MADPMELRDAEIRSVAEAGGAAPSGGNAQAWLVTVRDDEITLALHPERSDSFIDVGRAASILGLGSFTENASIALDALGLSHRVELLPLRSVEEPLVRIAITGRSEPPGEPPRLHRCIFERTTNRRAGSEAPVEQRHVEAMREAVRAFGDGWELHTEATAGGRAAIARVLAEADVVRTFERRFHEQMLSEMRWTPEEAARTRDGIDVSTLELPGGALTGLKLMRYRAFVAMMVSRSRIRTMSEQALVASSRLACVSMPREATAERLVVSGRALERAWLVATSLGLAVQPWCVLPFFVLRAETEPESLPARERKTILDLDRQISELFALPADRRAIFPFRLSHAEPPRVRALRLPWESFTRVATSSGSARAAAAREAREGRAAP